jgi:1,4-alpha-glucan branching enzyme
MHNRGPRYRKVELCGSFDDWKVRHDMSFDPYTNQWYINIHLKVGEEYYYKYIINDNQWVVNEEEPKKKDQSGNINNVCFL